MANTNRRYIDKNGNMFIPMNVEGGSWNEHFMTTNKLVVLGISLAVFIIMIVWLKGRYVGFSTYFLFIGIYLFIFQFILRYVVFEEKLYYSMYQELKGNEITTPSIFWNIATIRDNIDGAVLTYADGKVGILVKLDRDTIIGKDKEFMERHYDAIADFYRELNNKKLNFIQMNVMERAGNDPRLTELDKLTIKSDNSNINRLMELQVGYIKHLSQNTLYESDYLLVYTKDLSKLNSIVDDTVECIYKIIDGAYIGYRILDRKEIADFNKEQFGVKYFNETEATLSMFKNNDMTTSVPFKLSEIVFSTGGSQKVGNRELNIINKWTSDVSNGTLDITKVAIKDTIYKEDIKEEFNGIDFDTLSDGFEMDLELKEEKKEVKKKIIKKKKDRNLKVEKIDIHSDTTLEEFNVSKEEKNQQEKEKEEFEIKRLEEDDDIIDF